MTKFLALAALVASTALATAEPRVVLIEGTGPALPALATQIELHGGPIALDTVREGEPSALLAERTATMVVWIEPAADGRFVARALDRDGARALVAFDATLPAAEVERLIALKLVGVLDLAPRPVVAAPEATWVISVGAKLVAGDDRGAAGGPAVAVDRDVRLGRWRVAGGVQGRWLRSGTIDAPMATVGIDEVGLAARVEAGPAWRVAPFGSLAVVGAYYRANATTLDGRRGEQGELVPSLEPGVGVRLTLGSVLVTVRASLQHALIRQRFLVDREVVADLERTRGAIGLGIALPLR